MKEVHMGQPQKGYVPLTGGSMAVYNSSGLAYYRHSDWIGSSRLASTPTRSIYFDGAYAPFGEGYAETGTADLSFTGMNQDTVSNLYDFPDREYGIQGRWPSPDPAGMGSVDPRNPQSWNRYAYVLNNPLGFMDPTGECAAGSNQNQNTQYGPCGAYGYQDGSGACAEGPGQPQSQKPPLDLSEPIVNPNIPAPPGQVQHVLCQMSGWASVGLGVLAMIPEPGAWAFGAGSLAAGGVGLAECQ
jgi:RHS repeat-associated protein